MTSHDTALPLRPAEIPTQEYAPDRLPLHATAWGILAAGLGGAIVALIGWFAFRLVELPAFNTSMVTRALGTAGVVITLVVVVTLCTIWLRDRGRRPRWRAALTYVFTYLSPALLTLATIALPLAASRLWLEGIQVDQTFRTQFLTRMAQGPSYADMNYLGLPTFYPLGWFWLGGRMANLLGMPGWEVFQPWAIVSLSAAGCLLVPVWQRIVGSLPVATAIALVTTAVTLRVAAAEPYSAIIAMGAPAAAVLCSRAFKGSRLAMAGIAVFLGVSATFYTLFCGAIALTVVSLIGFISAAYERSWRPLLRLAVIAAASILIALAAWGPYLWASLHANYSTRSTAQHYLPEEGTQIPVPFLSFTFVGFLCLIGLVYLVVRSSTAEVRDLGWGVIGVYSWIVLSMVATLAGFTLLSFRLEIIVVLLLSTAGVLALAELYTLGFKLVLSHRLRAGYSDRLKIAFMILLGMAGLAYAQQIPTQNERGIDHAYTDTDGYGERADRVPADSTRYYADIDEFIEGHGHPAQESVVLTDEALFMAYHPYHGFNAFTSHYANPLGQFTERNEEIEAWAKQSWDETPQEFAAALDSAPWRGPDAIIFRGTLRDPGVGFKLHLAEDIYPNQPNVRYRAVLFNPDVFAAGWEMKQIGPFVVAVRTG